MKDVLTDAFVEKTVHVSEDQGRPPLPDEPLASTVMLSHILMESTTLRTIQGDNCVDDFVATTEAVTAVAEQCFAVLLDRPAQDARTLPDSKVTRSPGSSRVVVDVQYNDGKEALTRLLVSHVQVVSLTAVKANSSPQSQLWVAISA